MLQDYQVGDGPLWVIHIVVGTPWFITQTDSAGCLLRGCRWGSKKHMKQNDNDKKRKSLHKWCRTVDMAVGMDTSGGAARGEGWGLARRVTGMCSVRSIMVKARLYHGFAMLGVQTTPRRLRRAWTLGSLTCPDHARFRRSTHSRSVVFMRARGFHHAASHLFRFRIFWTTEAPAGGAKGCMYACAAE